VTNVLITVSGVIDAETAKQMETGLRPRPDYLELARALNADLLDYPRARAAGGKVGRILERAAGPNLMLAWACLTLSNRYRAILTDGEQVGIPLALMMKLRPRSSGRPRHIMIGHLLSASKKLPFFDVLRAQSNIDLFVVYASWQRRFAEGRLRVPASRVLLTPFMVDASFFSPDRVVASPRNMIFSAGLEFRDYPTLMEAVEPLDVSLVLAASSPWSKRSSSTASRRIPPNVAVGRFLWAELRQMYADSRFVVMPLYDVEFQAGVTAILEGMAMGKAVICSRTRGQTDVVQEGVTGMYVPPGDVAAMRRVIVHLLENPEEAARMGANARKLIEEEMNIDAYASRLKAAVHAQIERGGGA
jgi:glycosyltransferase involved in cell wall biosynthesis